MHKQTKNPAGNHKRRYFYKDNEKNTVRQMQKILTHQARSGYAHLQVTGRSVEVTGVVKKGPSLLQKVFRAWSRRGCVVC